MVLLTKVSLGFGGGFGELLDDPNKSIFPVAKTLESINTTLYLVSCKLTGFFSLKRKPKCPSKALV